MQRSSMNRRKVHCSGVRFACTVLVGAALLFVTVPLNAQSQLSSAQTIDYLFNDSHFQLANYIQDRLIDFATEAGLVVLIQKDVKTPFAKSGAKRAYSAQMKALLKPHPNATIIWAHIDVGPVIRPVTAQAAIVEDIVKDPRRTHVYFDISWEEVAKYVVATPESTKNVADMINRYPDRFLFGTEEVAPSSQENYLKVYYQYEALWKLLTREASEKVRQGNYERNFDEARKRSRNWDEALVGSRCTRACA
jgi:hypothetical protein